MAEPVRHRQTKGAATDMFDLQPPRHISTLRFSAGFILGGNNRFLQVSAFPLRIERSGTRSATGCQSSRSRTHRPMRASTVMMETPEVLAPRGGACLVAEYS